MVWYNAVPLRHQLEPLLRRQRRAVPATTGHERFVTTGYERFVTTGYTPFVATGYEPFVATGYGPFEREREVGVARRVGLPPPALSVGPNSPSTSI